MIIFDRVFQGRCDGLLSYNRVKSLGSIFSCGYDKIAHEYKYNWISPEVGTVLITRRVSWKLASRRNRKKRSFEDVHSAIPSGLTQRLSSSSSATYFKTFPYKIVRASIFTWSTKNQLTGFTASAFLFQHFESSAARNGAHQRPSLACKISLESFRMNPSSDPKPSP